MHHLHRHLVSPILTAPRGAGKTRTTRTTKNTKDLPGTHKTTMPKYQCPFPECTYETENVKDELAAVLLSVHSTGIHTASPASAAWAAAKVEKVRRPTVSAAGSSEEWSYFLTLELRGKTGSYNYLNVATNSYARPNKEHRRLANK